MTNVIYIDLIKLDATIVCCSRTPTYLRHLADGRVLKYPIVQLSTSDSMYVNAMAYGHDIAS